MRKYNLVHKMDYIKTHLAHITKVKIITLTNIITWRFTQNDIYMYVTAPTSSYIEIQTQPEFFTSLEEYLPNATKLEVKKLVPS